jgi:hypothetical protein
VDPHLAGPADLKEPIMKLTRLTVATAALAIASGCSCGRPEADPFGTSQEEVQTQVSSEEKVRMAAFQVSLYQALGDVNVDGRIDATDVQLIRELASGRRTVVPCADAADVNFDGVVNEQDAELLQAALDQGGVSALVLVPPGRRCNRRGTDIATRDGFAGDHVPVLFLRDLGISREATLRVLSGPGTLRQAESQLHWVDIHADAAIGDRIDLEVATRQQHYRFTIEVLDPSIRPVGVLDFSGDESLEGTGALLDGGTDGGSPGMDAGHDAGTDAGTDAGVDAGTDAGTDAGVDAGSGGGRDGGVDAGMDGGTDGGPDGGPDGGTDCPQRRKGCDALIVDLMYEWYMFSVGDMETRLKGIQCTTEFYDINANFKEKPRRVFVATNRPPAGFWNMTEAELAVRLAQWRAWRAGEQAKLDVAIATHVAHLREEKEIGIEVFNAHGSEGNCPACGSITTAEWEVSEPRRETIEAIYGGAHRRVCAWLLFDSSCFSGNSVRGFNTVNNTGACRCCEPPPLNPCFRAAFEDDKAVASSRITDEASNLTCKFDLSHFKDAIEEARAAGNNRVDRFINRRQFASSYVDDGYGPRCR